ncbi:hypothetical protein V1224_08450 [Lachnospiraceae bacterium JLR.KK008]
MVFAMLCYPQLSLSCALTGLNVWFQKMIPTLFPFMVLSGMMIRLRLSDQFAGFFRPLLYPFLRVNNRCLYCVIIGFLCGFPMGAKITADLYRLRQITKKEADFLLAFCNNIGPVFFTGFVLAFLPRQIPVSVYLFGMYGIPFLYGLFLRYLYYGNSLNVCGAAELPIQKPPGFVQTLDESILSAIQSITKLGGYMIFFNLLNVLPGLFLPLLPPAFTSLRIPLYLTTEITGGIALAGTDAPLLILTFLPFGGLSCIAQTAGMITGTDLSVFPYVIHKLCQSALTLCYYLFIFRIFM